MSTRRDFVKMTCGLCAALTGVGIASTFLQSCTSIPVIKSTSDNDRISVPVNSFEKSEYVLIRPNNLENDILLIRINTNSVFTYRAILMQCTHQHQPLAVTGQKIYCAAHGSEFDFQGTVLKEPATQPLKKFNVEPKDGVLLIDLKS